jgi:hypothetical protein
MSQAKTAPDGELRCAWALSTPESSTTTIGNGAIPKSRRSSSTSPLATAGTMMCPVELQVSGTSARAAPAQTMAAETSSVTLFIANPLRGSPAMVGLSRRDQMNIL